MVRQPCALALERSDCLVHTLVPYMWVVLVFMLRTNVVNPVTERRKYLWGFSSFQCRFNCKAIFLDPFNPIRFIGCRQSVILWCVPQRMEIHVLRSSLLYYRYHVRDFISFFLEPTEECFAHILTHVNFLLEPISNRVIEQQRYARGHSCCSYHILQVSLLMSSKTQRCVGV